ncbi:MAG: aldose 1-epimerase family protein [Eubacteriales bacterium]|nr:aldose 1-epimerase family protein [Eubacteriales bacterium]
MAIIAGGGYSKQELYRLSVNMDQLASIDEAELQDGRARGMKVYRVRSQSGLQFDLHAGRTLDIGALSYKGRNISLLTRNGVCTPENIFPANGEFDRYFGGGMLLTCGLKNAGPNYTNEAGQFQPLHGRIGTLPPEQCWKWAGFKDDEYVLEAGALCRDTTIEGHNLSLTRSIRTTLSNARIDIHDTVENLDNLPTDYLLLYHFNFGFPFLSDSLRLRFPEARAAVEPRTEAAEQRLSDWATLTQPEAGIEENVYFHFPMPDEAGTVELSLENPALGIGVRLGYEAAHLPYLIQWKCMRSGEYALGIEPGNNLISGLPGERATGRGAKLAPFERHEMHLWLEFYDL